MAGPGAIAATVLLAGRANGDLCVSSLLLAVSGGRAGAVLLFMFVLAARIVTLDRHQRQCRVSRLLGVLLARSSPYKFVINGVRTALGG